VVAEVLAEIVPTDTWVGLVVVLVVTERALQLFF